LYTFERKLWKEGVRQIAGVDEAGRGPLAGPVVAAAVVLPDLKKGRMGGLADSKQLSSEMRERLFVEILEKAAVGVGLVTEKRIDEINIFQAARQAMTIAIRELPQPPDAVLVDGRMRLTLSCRAQDLIRGDQRSASIAAASIVAKVTRDHIMVAYDAVDPRFSFYRHKGYATKEHLARLLRYGPSPFHRHSFYPIRKESSTRPL
jgi:ribonuclease HII